MDEPIPEFHRDQIITETRCSEPLHQAGWLGGRPPVEKRPKLYRSIIRHRDHRDQMIRHRDHRDQMFGTVSPGGLAWRPSASREATKTHRSFMRHRDHRDQRQPCGLTQDGQSKTRTAEAETGSRQRRSDRHLRLRLESGDVRQRRRRLRVCVGPLHRACVSVCCMSGFSCLCPVCVCCSPGVSVCAVCFLFVQ